VGLVAGRHRWPGAWLAVACTVLIGITGLTMASVQVGAAGADTPEERALAEARQRLERIQDHIAQAEAVAEDAEDALEDADATLREVEQVVNDIAQAVEGQRVAVREAQERLDRLEGERDELLAAFHQRAIRMYKLGPTRSWDVLLTGEDAAAALARTTYLRSLMEGDQVDLEAVASAEMAVAAERQRAEAEEQRFVRLLAEQQEVLAEVEELREGRALAAADARDRVRLLQEEQDDLEAEQERLEELIREREAERRRQEQARREAERRAAAQREAEAQRQTAQRTSPGVTSSGGYAWPLCAPVTSEYGPRWGRMHRGIDLGAPTGTPVGAAKAGTVIFAGWQGGYGRLLLLRHDDGIVTAYAHLSSFAVGEGARVGRGQSVGRIGTSGNSTGPHLHLEFRVGGQAQNPRQFLPGSPC